MMADVTSRGNAISEADTRTEGQGSSRATAGHSAGQPSAERREGIVTDIADERYDDHCKGACRRDAYRALSHGTDD
jgi:hypothetical protein